MYAALELIGRRRSVVTGSLKIANDYVAAITKIGHPAMLANIERCHSPVADLPTCKAPALRVTGDLDGYAVSFDADETIIFPTFDGAADASRAAREAQAQLAACLAVKPEAA